MKKTKFSHKVMAIFLVLTFSPSLFPVNYMFASNNGPNAPEAASFEPVDATDMVNLVTGDMSYVLPLLNVPSPEGGYPISLSYHAGIAMDQEASWVGLGWSLNPGAINRSVNGYPDDWGDNIVNEFFYDKGYHKNYYNFSTGVTFNNTVSVGLGASWGSDKSVGGYVSASVGLGQDSNGASLGVNIGTNGVGVSGGVAGINANVSTSGVGIGYGSRGGVGLGGSLNYNYNSGLTAGGSITGRGNNSSLGISFNSNNISANGSINGVGAGANNNSNGTNTGDITTNVSGTNFFLPIYMFYVGFSHQKISYSLFKYEDLRTSGMLYPVVSNSGYDLSYLGSWDNNDHTKYLTENNFMDVNLLPKFDRTTNTLKFKNQQNHQEKNNLVLPSYDNYVVSGQGLSGSISPYINTELNLSSRGLYHHAGNSLRYANYGFDDYNNPATSPNLDAVKKVNFTFNNSYNSFLRLETSNIIDKSFPPYLPSNDIMVNYETNNTEVYSNFNSLTGNRKREGNYIETYTNKEIRDGNLPNNTGFIEANNLNRSDSKVFLDEGIGAYQITTVDGRTYHYSLPVYNFESYYKNFVSEDGRLPDEDSNFLEIQKTTPYATHWLLTGITGPDYVDKNSDGKLNKGDHGYWVEFDYGKWSDSYIWDSKKGKNKYHENVDNEGNITYSYSWGRKQVYYLDAIKTRTHIALFVKNLRKDGVSEKTEIFSSRNNENFTASNYKQYKSKNTFFKYNVPKLYDPDGTEATVYNGFDGEKSIDRYVDNPKSALLKLNKIIVLKNKDNLYNKAEGDLVENNVGYFSNNIGYNITGISSASPLPSSWYGQKYVQPLEVLTAMSQMHQNILDIKDIENLDLESKALQVISFDHNYSLASLSLGSDAPNNGRLTLNGVSFAGKGNLQTIPPYKFSYEGVSLNYFADDEDDWGYNKNFPQAWSLNKIKTPTGGIINIKYESDSYYAEAATFDCVTYEDISFTKTNDNVQVLFDNNINLSDFFQIGQNVAFSFTKSDWLNTGPSGFHSVNPKNFDTTLEVLNVSNNQLTLIVVPDTEGFENGSANGSTSCIYDYSLNSNYCYSNLKIKNNKFPFYTESNSNGKKGGGIRVKEIQVSGGNTSITTEYDYRDQKTNKISGITSYAPSKEDKIIPYASELPSPTVMYSNVRMLNKDGKGEILGRTDYEFETLKPFTFNTNSLFNIGDVFVVEEDQNSTFDNGKVHANKFTISNNFGKIGRLISVSSYNSLNQKLHEKKNKYKTNLDSNGEIGVMQESHKSVKRFAKSGEEEDFFISSTSKITYPSVLESTTTNQGNFSFTTTFNKHDFLTGQVLETETTNSRGKTYKSVATPAYAIEEYSAMGSKTDDISNKNMLVQQAMNKTYIVDGANEDLVGANITTWSPTTYPDSEGVWRKHKSFVWNGNTDSNGVFNAFIGEDDNFNWTLEENLQDIAQPSHWKQTSEISMYDNYSMPLEVIDINGNKAATKMGDRHSKIIATTNSGYESMIYHGAEYGDLSPIELAGRTEEKAHTGRYSLEINNREGFFTRFDGHTPGMYRVSVWASKDNYENARVFDGTNVVAFNREKVFAGDWVMLNHEMELGSEVSDIYVTTIAGTTYFDDFRIHPLQSSMSSYVYNEWDELTHIIGANNLATEYRYDEAGRLIETRSEVIDFNGDGSGGFKKVSENEYTYKY